MTGASSSEMIGMLAPDRPFEVERQGPATWQIVLQFVKTASPGWQGNRVNEHLTNG